MLYYHLLITNDDDEEEDVEDVDDVDEDVDDVEDVEDDNHGPGNSDCDRSNISQSQDEVPDQKLSEFVGSSRCNCCCCHCCWWWCVKLKVTTGCDTQ